MAAYARPTRRKAGTRLERFTALASVSAFSRPPDTGDGRKSSKTPKPLSDQARATSTPGFSKRGSPARSTERRAERRRATPRFANVALVSSTGPTRRTYDSRRSSGETSRLESSGTESAFDGRIGTPGKDSSTCGESVKSRTHADGVARRQGRARTASGVRGDHRRAAERCASSTRTSDQRARPPGRGRVHRDPE
jgi:hypothetical protein